MQVRADLKVLCENETIVNTTIAIGVAEGIKDSNPLAANGGIAGASIFLSVWDL